MRTVLVLVPLVVAGLLLCWQIVDVVPAPPGGAESPAASGTADPRRPGDRTDAERVPIAVAPAPAGSAASNGTALPAGAVLVRLRGRVTEARTGRPLPGAELAVVGRDERTAALADGRFALDFALAGQRIAVECSHRSALPQRAIVWNRRVPADGVVEPFDFALLPVGEAAALVGRVFDDRAAPLPDVAVRLVATPPALQGLRPPEHAIEARTDATGRFAFAALPPGSWSLRLVERGFADYERAHLQLLPGSRTDLGAIRLERFSWARMIGRVVDGDGGGLADVTVSVRQPRLHRSGISDAEGRFRIERIEPGDWRVTFADERGGGGVGEVSFAAGETVRREIVFPGGPHFVGGEVLLGGRPASGLEVVVEIAGAGAIGSVYRQTRTGPMGRFRIDGLQPGLLNLGFTRERPYATFEAAAVEPDRDDHRFTFTAGSVAAVVTGVVRDDAGAPIDGAFVTPFEPIGAAARSRTGPDGRFRIEVELSSDATNLVVAEHPGYLTGRSVIGRDDVDNGGGIVRDFILVRADRLGTVEGLVTDTRSMPLPGVDCICHSDGDSKRWRVRTDSSGRFRIEGVAPGVIGFYAGHRDFQPYRGSGLQLDPQGRLELTLELTPLARFTRTVLVRGGRGEPLAGVEVDVWRGHRITAGVTDAAGRVRLRELPAGPIELSVEAVGYARHRCQHRVDAASSTEIVMDLRRGSATLAGTVVGADGAPRDDVEIIVRAAGDPAAAAVESITFSDDAGRFRVEHLEDGEYDVLVWSGTEQSVRSARPGDGPLRIVVPGR